MKRIIRKSSVIYNPEFSEPRTGKLFYAGIDAKRTNEDLARAVYEAIMCAESVVNSVVIKKSLDRNGFDVIVNFE